MEKSPKYDSSTSRIDAFANNLGAIYEAFLYLSALNDARLNITPNLATLMHLSSQTSERKILVKSELIDRGYIVHEESGCIRITQAGVQLLNEWNRNTLSNLSQDHGHYYEEDDWMTAREDDVSTWEMW